MHPTERGFARLRDEGGAPAVAPVDHHLAAAIQELRSTFRSGVTRSVDWRIGPTGGWGGMGGLGRRYTDADVGPACWHLQDHRGT